ncbi:hypothetical protein Brsp05_03052 [Brucella sp. NBRC 12953]|uniref:hypothetical protein n=1 Tax=Brucella sp. NBRC 12953 TaxID=3075481 RepID=UPI000DE2DE3B
MLLHVNNEMENGIIAKIPLALDKDIKGFQGDAIDFEISSPERQFIQADDFHPYKSLFKVFSGTTELKNIFIALSFNLNFSTPDGKKTAMSRSNPTDDWLVTNGEYYSEGASSFGFTSNSKFAGSYGASITNSYLYVIKNGSLVDNNISNHISIRAQFYPSSTYAVITPKDHISIILSNRQGHIE